MKKLKFYKLLAFIFLLFSQMNLFAQGNLGKYLVLLKDKSGTSFSIGKPLEFLGQRAIDRRNKQGIKITTQDLPPSQSYINQIKNTGATIWYKSRWLNAVLVLADSATALKIKALPFVHGFYIDGPLNLNSNGKLRKQFSKSKFETEIDTTNYGNGAIQANMLGVQNLHNVGIKGQNMIIGVLDDGFNRIDKDTNLKHLFDGKKIMGTFDFVRNTPNVYDIGGHGNLVLSTMAANTDGKFVGTAPMAKYVLLRTEDAPTEKLIEEANWLFGAEYADSSGVDVINTSLGYSDFDFAGYDHKTNQLDGKTTLVTQAADWAAGAGILVCVSAGNSGIAGIGAPADGDSVLAIGAVDKNQIKTGFSSIGPSADGRIKPDMAAMGGASTVSFVNANTGLTIIGAASGTSFSSPIFAGFATCFWQLYQSLKVMEVQAALKKLGSQAPKPDNLLGYGIPKLGKITILADEKEIIKGFNVFPNPTAEFLQINLPEVWKNDIYEIQITDLVGEKIFTSPELSGNQSINISKYSTGLFIGKLISSKGIINFKFLKN
jgi:serine protease AprX